MRDLPFYSAGLCFSCVRCSACCRKESGFVYLSENDLSRLADEVNMDYTAFIKTWCRWVPFVRDSERLSLREKSNYDCVFWSESGVRPPENADPGGNAGCTVYHARPLQCRTFPFWDSIVCSEAAWKAAGIGCPGINTGKQYTREEIEGFLCQMEEESVIERKILRFGGS